MLFTCDEDMLFSAFSNILTNCVRYAGNRITIMAFQRKSPGSLTVRISNDGQMISKYRQAEKMAMEEKNGKVPSEIIPHCPKCGGSMQIHLEIDRNFIRDNTGRERFQTFLNQYHGKKLVVLELGIGPRNQLIKAPLMRLVDMEPNATYVTINLGELYITDNIKAKSFALDGYLGEILSRLREACVE